MTPERIAELREEIARNKATGYHDEGIGTFDSLTMEAALDALEEAQAELATAKDAYVELAAGIRITEAEGGPLEQANQEIDRLRAELARLQSPAPVGGGVPECPECGSTELEWTISHTTRSSAPDGRLRMSEISTVATLGCGACSATVRALKEAEIVKVLASRLPALKTGEVEALRCVEGRIRELAWDGVDLGRVTLAALAELDALRAQATADAGEGGKA